MYSLAQWLTLGEPLYVKYAILIFGSLLFSLLQFGIGAQYVWRGNTWMELHTAGLASLIAATGSFLFIEQALEGPDVHPWISRLMKAGAGFTVFFALCFSFDLIDIYIVTAVISTLGLAPALLGLPGAISRARRGDSVGIYFLLAWAAYFVTTAVHDRSDQGARRRQLLDPALLPVWRHLRHVGIHAGAGLANQSLAQGVVNMPGVNGTSLHSLAHTDPLTGLPNRRSLNASMLLDAISHSRTGKYCRCVYDGLGRVQTNQRPVRS